jgi:hypothetical protein
MIDQPGNDQSSLLPPEVPDKDPREAFARFILDRERRGIRVSRRLRRAARATLRHYSAPDRAQSQTDNENSHVHPTARSGPLTRNNANE